MFVFCYIDFFFLLLCCFLSLAHSLFVPCPFPFIFASYLSWLYSLIIFVSFSFRLSFYLFHACFCSQLLLFCIVFFASMFIYLYLYFSFLQLSFCIISSHSMFIYFSFIHTFFHLPMFVTLYIVLSRFFSSPTPRNQLSDNFHLGVAKNCSSKAVFCLIFLQVRHHIFSPFSKVPQPSLPGICPSTIALRYRKHDSHVDWRTTQAVNLSRLPKHQRCFENRSHYGWHVLRTLHSQTLLPFAGRI